MHTTPNISSLSVAGPGRLLAAVTASAKALGKVIRGTDVFLGRLTVFFPKPDEQWPMDASGKRLVLKPRDVIAGNIKHARLQLDGVSISRQAAQDAVTVAEAESGAASKALHLPYKSPTGRVYSFTIDGSEETVNHTHQTLIADCTAKLRGLGQDPRRVLAHYR